MAHQKTKDCYPSICNALRIKGISCDTVDIRALTDSKLSCGANKKNILKQVGASSRGEMGRYEAQYEDFMRTSGLKVRKPCTPPVKVKGHCRKCPKIKVKPHKRACPSFRLF